MIDLRQERYESVPEFIREPHAVSREKVKASLASAFKRGKISNRTMPATSATYDDLEFGGLEDELTRSKSAELETLWPGVDHDFLQVSQRGPSFYLMLGFLSGAVMSLAGLWVYTWLTHASLSYAPVPAKKMIVTAAAGSKTATTRRGTAAAGNAEVTTLVPVGPNADLVVPAFSTYEVKDGDTLAVIAVKAYHRVSPRLLDAICKANGMRSADVLNLGQKLVLPEYRPSLNQLSSPATQQ